MNKITIAKWVLAIASIVILYRLCIAYGHKGTLNDGTQVFEQDVDGTQVYTDMKTGNMYTSDTPAELRNWPECMQDDSCVQEKNHR